MAQDRALRGQRRRAGGSLLGALLGAALIGALTYTLTELLNPDWYGYQLIYEQEGGWLADQGRDPIFLWFMSTAAAMFGPDGYDDFRWALATYFVAFTALLASGGVLGYGPRRPALTALVVALLLFAATRFTIQIREGLALTVALWSLRPVWAGDGTPPRPGWTLAGLLLASLIHAGLALLVAAFVAAWFFGGTRRAAGPSVRRGRNPAWGLALAALLAGGLLMALTLLTGRAAGAIDMLVEGRETVSGASSAKFVFWTGIALCMGTIAAAAARAFDPVQAGQPLSGFVRWLAIGVLPALFGALYVQLIWDVPAVLISGTARSLQLVSGLLMILLVLRFPVRAVTVAAALVLLLDQVRVGIEAALGYAEGLGL